MTGSGGRDESPTGFRQRGAGSPFGPIPAPEDRRRERVRRVQKTIGSRRGNYFSRA